jgi:uncharacterized protein (TIGR02145 family)
MIMRIKKFRNYFYDRKNCYSLSIIITIVISSLCVTYTARAQTTLRDRDSNTYIIKILPDNKPWLTSNLAINIPGSYNYDTAAPKNHHYGRLYTWKAAQEGCALLGEGWHLPTNEDWQHMAKFYGGVRDDSEDGGKAAYQALIDSGSSGFNAVYGGRWDTAGYYHRVGAHGFYWTATETDSTHAWFYNLGRNGKIVNRHQDGEKYNAISVRCVRDSGNKIKQ